MDWATASSTEGVISPVRLTFTTAGAMWLAAIQSMPASTCSLLPLPVQSRTRTGWSVTPLATPQVVPPAVPATWVPWP